MWEEEVYKCEDGKPEKIDGNRDTKRRERRTRGKGKQEDSQNIIVENGKKGRKARIALPLAPPGGRVLPDN